MTLILFSQTLIFGNVYVLYIKYALHWLFATPIFWRLLLIKLQTKTLIKGPWSPLELDFQSLCHSSNTKQVKIDNNSVNSVVLDTEPTAPISRLLVAGYVGIQDRSGSVVARDTTIMPSVPGLLSLMAMLFAPKIELRIDVRQTKYTGVLCGLGSAPHEPDLPIYPDHDVEIIFDTVIDDDDIDSVT